ncbi:hypothetical protein CEXT_595591 [Caerostris extrusa]|uniref:Uncharacterized protein n=1 Tax=Caerostris extrusa TaxID=172846 RepID=A0AAV4Y0I9_CAEEX|nr:hypothetical protein CEXT_595591 [Caerostris extrusa]
MIPCKLSKCLGVTVHPHSIGYAVDDPMCIPKTVTITLPAAFAVFAVYFVIGLPAETHCFDCSLVTGV